MKAASETVVLIEEEAGRAMSGTPSKMDVPIPAEQRAPIRFTFFWTNNSSWEDRDYTVEVES